MSMQLFFYIDAEGVNISEEEWEALRADDKYKCRISYRTEKARLWIEWVGKIKMEDTLDNHFIVHHERLDGGTIGATSKDQYDWGSAYEDWKELVSIHTDAVFDEDTDELIDDPDNLDRVVEPGQLAGDYSDMGGNAGSW